MIFCDYFFRFQLPFYLIMKLLSGAGVFFPVTFQRYVTVNFEDDCGKRVFCYTL